jgi:protocatechuate 3,4-dioxygenase beta subunit
MKRRDLLKTFGAIGLASSLPAPAPARARTARSITDPAKADCWLTTALAEGPFYFDAQLFRSDIRTDSDTGEFHDGVPLSMNVSVINANCEPIPGALVDVWHCDTPGLYSGYVQQGGNTVGEDFMRGLQATDAAGQCSFLTSYPGWYPGRATHVHFKVHLDAFTYVTSQFAFPEEVSDVVHQTPLYADRGICPTRNADDGIFRSVDLEHLMMAVEPDDSIGGYAGSFTVGIDAEVTGVGDALAGAPPLLEQNFPNPFNPRTTIRFNLPASEHVDLRVYDARGHEVAVLVSGSRPAGSHELSFDGRGLPSGFYFYRLVSGEQTASRQMLLIK